MSELVSVVVIIYFVRFPGNHGHHCSNVYRTAIRRVASEVPAFLILVGILGIAVALIVEMLHISIGTAIAMSGIFIFGFVFCFLAWVLGIGGRALY